jgi:hypothetical protein
MPELVHDDQRLKIKIKIKTAIIVSFALTAQIRGFHSRPGIRGNYIRQARAGYILMPAHHFLHYPGDR